jgi:hypothetical protein
MELQRDNHIMIVQATDKLAIMMLLQGKAEEEVVLTLLQFGIYKDQIRSIIQSTKARIFNKQSSYKEV